MKKSISLLLLSLLMIAPSCQKPKETTNEYNIVPQPNQLVPKEGRFELNNQVRLVAPSDAPEVKKVADGFAEQLKQTAEMPEGMDVDETKDWMRRHTDELEETARQTILAENRDYTVSAAVTTCYFPDKTYGDVTFPAGNYEALRIEIGAAKGHNWWCVLYPNLCFTDATNAVVPEEGKEELKNVLTEDEYAEVTAQSDFKIKWYFLERFK